MDRINRNILECKGRCSAFYETFTEVLIETYWNVKEYDEEGHLISEERINRNILECKDL